MTEQRKPGYYRVKYDGVWLIDRYDPILGFQMFWDSGGKEMEDEFDEIIETPISPEPQKEVTDGEIEKHFTTSHFDGKNGHHYRRNKDRIFGAKWMRDLLTNKEEPK